MGNSQAFANLTQDEAFAILIEICLRMSPEQARKMIPRFQAIHKETVEAEESGRTL